MFILIQSVCLPYEEGIILCTFSRLEETETQATRPVNGRAGILLGLSSLTLVPPCSMAWCVAGSAWLGPLSWLGPFLGQLRSPDCIPPAGLSLAPLADGPVDGAVG